MEKNRNLLSLLSKEEKEIMELYIIGMKNDQICKRINSSRYFIYQKVKSVIKKLNAKNRINAIALLANEIEKQNISKELHKYSNKSDSELSIYLTLNFNLKFT